MKGKNHLLGLPVELRLRIYEALYEQERDVEVPACWDERHNNFGLWDDTQPSITRVNRQIRAESLPTFYSFCTFHVWTICGACVPDDITQAYLTRENVPTGPVSETCQCIPDRCYDRRHGDEKCCSWYLKRNTWRWIAGLGPSNLSHVKMLTLEHHGVWCPQYVGYKVSIHQHPDTKRLSISAEDSYWQGDYDPSTRAQADKIPGSDSRGQAIIEEIYRSLDSDGEGSREPGSGLTVARIFRILHISYRRSYGGINIGQLLARED